jgi:integrase
VAHYEVSPRDVPLRGHGVAKGGGKMRGKVKLTARSVEAAKPGTELRDSQVPGLRLRTSPQGHKRFILVTHYPGAKNASRRGLTATTLAEAREEALQWRQMIRRGIDPHVQQERQRLERLRKQRHSFLAVCETYFADLHRRKLRTAAKVERDIRRELIPLWADRPITDIARADVIAAINQLVSRGVPGRAHGIFALCRGLFGWAVHCEAYGLTHSPCTLIKPVKLIGQHGVRQRVLTDAELKAFWHGTERLGYPGGSFLRALLLTGARRNEVVGARWGEFEFNAKLWTIPAERCKSGSAHIVPLTADMLALLCELPRFPHGDLLFTANHGSISIGGFSRRKAELDRLMLAELRKEDPRADLVSFVLHDLRRTVRTRLSALRVPDTVAEMVIGHGRRGLQRIYDQHAFVDEMREALEAWNTRLRSIVNPTPPANVVVWRHA